MWAKNTLRWIVVLIAAWFAVEAAVVLHAYIEWRMERPQFDVDAMQQMFKPGDFPLDYGGGS